MPSGKLALAGVLAALALAACGSSTPPQAGAGSFNAAPAGRAVVDDPRTQHIKCLQNLNLTVVKRGKSDLLIGTPPNQVAAIFVPTPGAAQDEQISGHVQGAEVIGSALLYPGVIPDTELKGIEGCLGQGVKG